MSSASAIVDDAQYEYSATPVADIAPLVAGARAYHRSRATLPLAWRRAQLRALHQCVKQHEAAWERAVGADLGVERNQVFMRATALLFNDIALALAQLDAWCAPTAVSVPLIHRLDRPSVKADAKGTVLIIGAWNYPMQLILVPLVGALAAGCCAVVKPSELAPRTAALAAALLPRFLDQHAVAVVNGAVPETTELLAQRFDHILYTGGSAVARVVMAAAAKHLTPVTLELGGKCPALVDDRTDLAIVARRVAWGAMMNAGQTCVRADYVLTLPHLVEPLVAELKKALTEFYGEKFDADNKTLGRIINDRHFARVTQLLDDTKGKIVFGNERVPEHRYLSPTVVVDVEDDDALMNGEIFGPILPIKTVKSMDEAIDFVNDHEKPLALYCFTNDKALWTKVLNETSSGGIVKNDCIMHCAISELPFGGVGESGQGAYHGKHSFDMFSHQKAVLHKELALEAVNDLRYPPMTDKKRSWLAWLAVNEPSTSWFASWFGGKD